MSKNKTVYYEKLTPVLIEAIKDLKKEKDGEIAKLQSENEILKSENQEIWRVICEITPGEVKCNK